MSDQALVIRNDAERTIAFLPQATKMKEEALGMAALVGKVENAAENEKAFAAQSALAELRRQVEKARVAAKEPVLDFGRKIDAAAKAFVSDIGNEEMRIATLIGDFQQLEQAKARAAEKARQLEAERVERERQAELRRIAEEQARVERERQAELRRIAEAEQAAKRALDAERARADQLAREATNAKERAEAEKRRKEMEIRAAKEREESERARIELERAQALAASESHKAFDAANERFNNEQAAVVSAPVAAPVRAEGQTVKTDVEITVSDIWLLAKAHPTCVKIEPRIAEIKTLLAAGVKVAGIITKEVTKSSARTAYQPKAIDV